MSRFDLRNADCFEVMRNIPDASVDMICTDPPFGMDYENQMSKTKKWTKINNDNNLNWLDDFAAECYRISKNNTAHYMFCSWHKVDVFKQAFEKHFNLKGILIWEKNGFTMGDLEASFGCSYEMVLAIQKGRKKMNGKRQSNVIRFNRTNNDYHPTQKPVDLMKYLIGKFSKVNDVILDPFMGSGSTGVACSQIKRKFMGIEMSEDYFITAKQRIERGIE